MQHSVDVLFIVIVLADQLVSVFIC